jgi:2-polyprenyl-3-methyl-5-hydroxy-6-metoxy-1,4-benzoquinol methylase
VLALVTRRPSIPGLRTAFVDASLWEELSLCPICRRDEYLRDIGTVEGESLGTVVSVCLDCEHGFLRRRPSKEWYDRFYLRDWDQAGQKSAAENGIRFPPNVDTFNFCAPHLLNNSEVLDIGAGFGSLLLPFRNHGHNVYGIERSPHRAQYLQDVLKIPCSNLPIESFKPSRKFDLICMYHVLEHVSDPAEAISILAEMLSKRGMIYIAVPDFWRGEYAPQAFHFVPHVSWFTVKSLQRLLTKNGFSLVKKLDNKEIQFLAVKETGSASDMPDLGDPVSRSAFWNRTSGAMLEAFGHPKGNRTLLWFIDWNQQKWFYQRHVLPGSRVTSPLVQSLFTVAHSLPERLYVRIHRYLPDFVRSDGVRMLTVDLRGDRTLPITIRHPYRQAPVWIK